MQGHPDEVAPETGGAGWDGGRGDTQGQDSPHFWPRVVTTPDLCEPVSFSINGTVLEALDWRGR